jgi:preprotein translocase subunit SecE
MGEMFVKNYSILIWIGVLAVVFALMWWGGQLTRLSNYCRETGEELKKCTWPTWAELKGSTIVVFISILLLGVFTMAVDWLFANLVRILT